MSLSPVEPPRLWHPGCSGLGCDKCREQRASLSMKQRQFPEPVDSEYP